MRWAQVFKTTSPESGHLAYSTGTTDFADLGSSTAVPVTVIGEGASDGLNKAFIVNGTTSGYMDSTTIVTADGATINGNTMDYIGKNYIRISSKGQVSGGNEHNYNRTELEDALVFNLLVPVNQSKVLYFVVWLHENGQSQNPVAGEGNPTEENFFGGLVTFMSGQGGEVSATFSGITKVNSQA